MTPSGISQRTLRLDNQYRISGASPSAPLSPVPKAITAREATPAAAHLFAPQSVSPRAPLPLPVDTTTPGGKLIFHIFGSLAEFERDLIRERTQAGLAAARARGRKGGRPKKLGTPGKLAMARSLYNDKNNSIADICKTLGISRATLYRYLDTAGAPIAGNNGSAAMTKDVQ